MTKYSPATGLPMKSIVVLGVTIDVCPQTGGIWFDEGELQLIKGASVRAFVDLEKIAVPEATPAPQAATARQCPNDQTPLRTYRYLFNSNVFLDECPKCGGIWIDDGELQSMHLVLAEQSAYPTEIPKEVVAQMELARFESEHLDRMALIKGVTGALTILGKRRVPFIPS